MFILISSLCLLMENVIILSFRLKAIDVLNHPLFWSPRKRVAFLHSFEEQLLLEIRDYDSQSRALYAPILFRVVKETWAEEIGSIKLTCTSYEGLLKSLQFLRDMNIYYLPVTELCNRPPDDFEVLLLII